MLRHVENGVEGLGVHINDRVHVNVLFHYLLSLVPELDRFELRGHESTRLVAVNLLHPRYDVLFDFRNQNFVLLI